jgi:hypothetical protein
MFYFDLWSGDLSVVFSIVIRKNKKVSGRVFLLLSVRKTSLDTFKCIKSLTVPNTIL